MERSVHVDKMKLHRVKYSGDFIPYNLTELFQGWWKTWKIYLGAILRPLPFRLSELTTTLHQNTC